MLNRQRKFIIIISSSLAIVPLCSPASLSFDVGNQPVKALVRTVKMQGCVIDVSIPRHRAGGHADVVSTNSRQQRESTMSKATTPDVEQFVSDYENLLNGDFSRLV